MQYSLGNMLKGGGALNPDGLALDLAFALDKTLTARRGPTPTFTRGSTGTFVGSNGLIQSAAINVPRFNHDPATGDSKGLLIEESRTNLATWSQEFEESSGWDQTTFAIVTANQIASPSGAIDADLITAKNSSYGGLLRKIGPPAYAASTTYTMSVYAKAGTHQFLGMRLSSDSAAVGGNSYSVFTLSGAGSATAVTPTAGTINSVSCVNVGGGWYRCILTYTTASTAPASTTDIAIAQSNGNVSYTPTGTETVYLWGAQLEAGAFPLSYIPTTSGTAARSADVCSIIGTDFSSFYNQSEGTLFGDVTPQTISQASAVLYVGDGGTQFQNGIYKSNSLLTAAGLRWGVTTVSTGFSTQASIVTATDVATSRSKLAYGFKLDDFGFAYEGTLVGTDSSGTLPATNPSQMGIGNRNGSIQINGHIARIQYFRKRLSNAKLQTLTTP